MTEPARARHPSQQLWRWWVLYGLALALLPVLLADRFAIGLLSQIGISILICLSYYLLLGQAGLLSFGHALYTGVGAFAAIHWLQAAQQGAMVPVVLIPLLAGVCTMAVAWVTGWLSTRRGGLVFAMITLGLGELAWTLAQRFPAVFGGEAGISGNRAAGQVWPGTGLGPDENLYMLIAVYTFVCSWLMYRFTKTPFALTLRAMREQPVRVATLGFDIRSARFRVVWVSAFFAGVAGGLSALHFELVTNEVFSVTRSGSYLLFTLVGGTSSFAGPILGGVLMVLATDGLSSLTGAWQLYLGLLFVIAVLRLPEGLGGWLSERWAGLRTTGLTKLSWTPVRTALGMAMLALSVVAGIEMTYQYQLREVLGPERILWGVVLDSQRLAHWLGVLCLAGLGWATAFARRGPRAD